MSFSRKHPVLPPMPTGWQRRGCCFARHFVLLPTAALPGQLSFPGFIPAGMPDNLTGRSLVPFLRGETPDNWRNTIFTQFNGVELYYSQRAVITHDYKYVYNGFDFDELYDLHNDPRETVNLAQDSNYRDVIQELVARMWRFAVREKDEIIFNPYGTVALAPWGSTIAFKE